MKKKIRTAHAFFPFQKEQGKEKVIEEKAQRDLYTLHMLICFSQVCIRSCYILSTFLFKRDCWHIVKYVFARVTLSTLMFQRDRCLSLHLCVTISLGLDTGLGYPTRGRKGSICSLCVFVSNFLQLIQIYFIGIP